MKNLLYIGNKLQQANKTVTTIDTLSENFKTEGFDVVTASSKKNVGLRLLDMLYHILKHRKTTDYVIIDTYSTLNFYYAYFCTRFCRGLKLRYIPILHGGKLPDRLKKSPNLSKAIFTNAHINVAPSKYLMSHFEKAGYKNVVYIPNTIELENYPFKQRHIDKVKLLWVRSFSNIYNPSLAVKTLRALKDENIEAGLCMVGPDNDGSLQEVKNLARELEVDVKFTGKLSKEDWIVLSSNYNIFINTTNVDNTPVSVMESMALGLPVISTNVGGMSFLIEDRVDGILVEPNNVEAFVIAIKNVMHAPKETIEITNNARKKIESFDWKVVNQEWLKILS